MDEPRDILREKFNMLLARIEHSPFSLAAVCRHAGCGYGWLRNVIDYRRPLKPQTYDLIERSFEALKIGRPGLVDHEGFRLYRLALALAVRYADRHVPGLAGASVEGVLAQDPARRATEDPVWMRAAQLRRTGVYLAYRLFPLSQARLGRIVGLKKASVSLAIKEIEIEREKRRCPFEPLFAEYEALLP